MSSYNVVTSDQQTGCAAMTTPALDGRRIWRIAGLIMTQDAAGASLRAVYCVAYISR